MNRTRLTINFDENIFALLVGRGFALMAKC